MFSPSPSNLEGARRVSSDDEPPGPRLRSRRATALGGAHPAVPVAATAGPAAGGATAGGMSLAFADAQLERAFAEHYAASMWRFDAAAILLLFLFYCVLLFAAGPLGHMWWKLPGSTKLRGVTYLYWLPVLLIPRLRRWYLRHRDGCLLGILAGMAAYMWSVGNHQAWVDPEFATHFLFQGGFSWLTFTLMMIQPRAPTHRLGCALLVAMQLPALHTYCSDHFGATLGTCLVWGNVKVCVLALLPHVAVCRLEARARRLFLQAQSRPAERSRAARR